MNLDLTGKVIVIASTAQQNGPEQIFSMLRDERAIVIGVGEINGGPRKYVTETWYETQLGSAASCQLSVQKIIAQYGKVDCLINFAGSVPVVVPGQEKPFTDPTSSVNSNLVRYFNITHELVPALKKSVGTILNINLIDRADSFEDEMIMSLTRGGQNSLTREWAVELLKYNIRVNALIATTSADYNFMQIAAAAAFIISERSSHTTGQLIEISGNN